MKAFVVMLVLLFGSATAVEAGPLQKLGRGLVNIVSAPLEVPKQARAYWIEGAQKTDHILVWIFSGTGKGMVEGVKRAGSGVWDLVSFPVNFPQDYRPIYQPDWVFEEWPVNPGSGR